jgi:hypothetical protein
MPTPAQLKTWEAWVHERTPERGAFVAFLREQQALAGAPLVFARLDNGGWHIDGHDHRGRLPMALGIVWEALQAAQAHTPAPPAPNARNARKALRDAVNWAEKRARSLIPVLRAVGVRGGQMCFDARHPGCPKVALDFRGVLQVPFQN